MNYLIIVNLLKNISPAGNSAQPQKNDKGTFDTTLIVDKFTAIEPPKLAWKIDKDDYKKNETASP